MTPRTGVIRLKGAMDLASTLESGQSFRWRKATSGELGDHYEGVVFGNLVRTLQVDGEVHFMSAPDGPDALEPLFRDYLGLGHDLESAYAFLELDEVVGRAIGDHTGMRILRQEPWECLASFICSANNNIARISQNVEALASAFGQAIPGAGSERRAFPPATAVAEAGEAALRALGLGFRAKYLAAASQAVYEGQIDLYALREAPYDEALEALVTLAGVGDKVANCVLLFSLDKFEAFPVDVWIDRALRDWYFTEEESKTMPRTRMRVWAQERFGRHAGYANQYLFHSRRLEGRQR